MILVILLALLALLMQLLLQESSLGVASAPIGDKHDRAFDDYLAHIETHLLHDGGPYQASEYQQVRCLSSSASIPRFVRYPDH